MITATKFQWALDNFERCAAVTTVDDFETARQAMFDAADALGVDLTMTVYPMPDGTSILTAHAVSR